MDSDEEIGSEEEMESVGGEEERQAEAESTPPAGAIPVTDCLFCPHHSRSLTKNVAHMTKAHSFFIPDIEYLVDLRGLIKYLGVPANVLQFLYCLLSLGYDFKSFWVGFFLV